MNRRNFIKKTIAALAGIIGVSAIRANTVGQEKFKVGCNVLDDEGRVALITEILPRYPKQWSEGCGIYSRIWDSKYPNWRTETMAVLTYKKRVDNLNKSEQREYNCYLAKQNIPFPDGIVMRHRTKTLIRPLSSLRKVVIT